MALDEPNENDSSFEAGGFTFCLDNKLLERVNGVNIDVSYMGFIVSPVVPLASGSSCGSCGGSCGSK